jgi:hypothetical protein
LRARSGTWTAGQVLAHCAESIDCSIRGFPSERSRLFQATIGRLVLAVFFARGALRHDRNATIPGAAEPPELATDAGLERLIAAIDVLAAAPEPLARHAVFGAMTRAEYERYHAMHVADHLGELEKT